LMLTFIAAHVMSEVSTRLSLLEETGSSRCK
jgi:hypothetical protein